MTHLDQLSSHLHSKGLSIAEFRVGSEKAETKLQFVFPCPFPNAIPAFVSSQRTA